MERRGRMKVIMALSLLNTYTSSIEEKEEE